MSRFPRFANIALAGLVLLVAAIWTTAADAHGRHAARTANQFEQTIPGASDAAATVRPTRPDDAKGGCALDCCVGGATCVAHVGFPPVNAPVMPEPGSMVLRPAPAPDLAGITGERLPRPPRAA